MGSWSCRTSPGRAGRPRAEPVFAVLDRSARMTGWWDAVVASLEQFVRAPESEHLDIALQYFPRDDAACDGTGYESPDIPMLPLPGAADPIVDSLTARALATTSDSQLEGALRGATAYLGGLAHADDTRSAIVLILAGAATGCDPTTDLPEIVETAWSRHGVQTYGIGLGEADIGLLDALAQASLADCSEAIPGWACRAGASDGGSPDIGGALEAVRHAVSTITTGGPASISSCQWALPDPPAESLSTRR